MTTRIMTTSKMDNGQIRLSLMQDGKECFHAIVSPSFDKGTVNGFSLTWSVFGQKPYGFITEDTKAL